VLCNSGESTPIAIETAHVALMTDDCGRLPELFAIVRRTMGVVKVTIDGAGPCLPRQAEAGAGGP
jgi:cation transport ATPase